MTRVSIILPVHNGEDTIERSLQSIAHQTYRNFETVLVNNNCTDGTLEIASKYKKQANIRIVDCKPKGLVCALNFGIQNSSAPLIARQDDDDYWHPTKLEKQVNFLDENPGVNILGTQIQLVDTEGKKLEIGTYGRAINYPATDRPMKQAMMIGQNPLCHPSVILKRDVILRVGGYADHFHLAEDFHLWIRLLPWATFANLSEVLIDYTQTVRSDYDPRTPIYIADMYYNLYKMAGVVSGERPKVLYDWQVKEMQKNV